MISVIDINIQKITEILDMTSDIKLTEEQNERIDRQVKFHIGNGFGVVMPRDIHEKITRQSELSDEEAAKIITRRTR